MFDFALEQLSLVGREIVQAIDTSVDVGFTVGQFVRLAGDEDVAARVEALESILKSRPKEVTA